MFFKQDSRWNILPLGWLDRGRKVPRTDYRHPVPHRKDYCGKGGRKMIAINHFEVLGNLTRDPRQCNGGCFLSVASNDVYKDKEGNRQKTTKYLDVTVFGKQAETCLEFLGKGAEVYVRGHLGNRKKENGFAEVSLVGDRVQFGRPQKEKN